MLKCIFLVVTLLLSTLLLSGCLESAKPLFTDADYPIPSESLLEIYTKIDSGFEKLEPEEPNQPPLSELIIEGEWYVYREIGEEEDSKFKLHQVDDSNWLVMVTNQDMNVWAYYWLRREHSFLNRVFRKSPFFVLYRFESEHFLQWAEETGIGSSGWEKGIRSIQVSSLSLLINALPRMIHEGYFESASAYRVVEDTNLNESQKMALKADRESAIKRCRELAGSKFEPGSRGLGVEYDDINAERAITVCRVAVRADPSDPNRYRLARSLDKNEEYDDANKHLEIPAQNGYAPAQYNLGLSYLQGEGVAQNKKKGVSLFREAADQGYPPAQYNIGWLYQAGQELPQDDEKAIMWFQKSAVQGFSYAQQWLGTMYSEGRGVARDYKQALRWFRKSAEQNNPYAQGHVGYSYHYGLGVLRDYSQAAKWYRKSAEQGIVAAQINLGHFYIKGHGVSRNYSEAVKWYRRAAKQGDASGQYNLGLMYYHGMGVRKDWTHAASWLSKSAAQNFGRAFYDLGVMYENGEGVARNRKKALQLYLLAQRHGDAELVKRAKRAQLVLLFGGGRRGSANPSRQEYGYERKVLDPTSPQFASDFMMLQPP